MYLEKKRVKIFMTQKITKKKKTEELRYVIHFFLMLSKSLCIFSINTKWLISYSCIIIYNSFNRSILKERIIMRYIMFMLKSRKYVLFSYLFTHALRRFIISLKTYPVNSGSYRSLVITRCGIAFRSSEPSRPFAVGFFRYPIKREKTFRAENVRAAREKWGGRQREKDLHFFETLNISRNFPSPSTDRYKYVRRL